VEGESSQFPEAPDHQVEVGIGSAKSAHVAGELAEQGLGEGSIEGNHGLQLIKLLTRNRPQGAQVNQEVGKIQRAREEVVALRLAALSSVAHQPLELLAPAVRVDALPEGLELGLIGEQLACGQ